MIKNYLSVLAVFLFGLTGFSQEVGVSIDAPIPVCWPGSCTELKAVYTVSDTQQTITSEYNINSIPYQNIYPYTGGTQISNSGDDLWSNLVALPFTFYFYGIPYNSMLVGSNGVVTFDTVNNAAGTICPYQFDVAIPNTNFPIKNAIYGVYQDTDIRPIANGGNVTDPEIQNVNYYVSGIAPNRVYVINFNELPLYGVTTVNILQTSQIVLYETTNIIDIHIKKRENLPGTNNAVERDGVVGIQNYSGTQARSPFGRNTGQWTANEESWRFQPAGNTTLTSLAWMKDGVFYSDQNPINICPLQNETYNVVANFQHYNGTPAIATASINVTIEVPLPIADPLDIAVCSNATPSFDLTTNTPVMLGDANPQQYEIYYLHSYQDAVNYANPINNPQNYPGVDGEVIYTSVTDYFSGAACPTIKSFTLTVNTPLIEPSGDTEQSFTAGETLADIELAGSAVDWYAAAEGGEPLPVTTVLVDATTYYAELSDTNGCTALGRSALAERFAVTVSVALGIQDWVNFKFKAIPNPVKDILNISSAANITAIAIYNLLGQEVIQQNVGATEVQVSMAGLPDGTYLMKVSGNNFIQTMKVIKQ